MSWKKFFNPVANVNYGHQGGSSRVNSPVSKFSNWLPEVYQGPPNRMQRYTQYEQMDLDHEINAALDTLSEFSTQLDDRTGVPFQIRWKGDPSPSEVVVLEKVMKQWCYLNEFPKRIFRIFRSTLIYGDQIFIRDPETFKLIWTDPASVEKVIVNESRGKKIEIYFINNLDLNLQTSVATNMSNKKGVGGGALFPNASPNANYNNASATSIGTSGSFSNTAESTPVDATNIVQISLTEGMDAGWPFGTSILEPIFKVYKQKELLEDSVLIYRIHRAPERRVFKIDVGTMPPNKAQQYLERVKYEVQQKRIPSRTGGGNSIIDSSYNPMCLDLSTRIPLLDGRTLSLTDLIDEYENGKENYTYSQNRKTHELEPGKIVWAGVTRKEAEVVRVHLDNGEFVDATPDHKFIMRDGTEVEAQYLSKDDSLMPMYFNDAKTSPKQKGTPYLRYISNADGKIRWVHTCISPKEKPGKNTEIHHIDFNSKNNNPTNLVEMDTHAHRQLHSNAGTYSIGKQWSDPIARQKLVTGINNFHTNATYEDKKMLSARNTANGKHTWDNEDSAQLVITALKETQSRVAVQRTILYSESMFARMLVLYNAGYDSVLKIRTQLKMDSIFQEEFMNANTNLLREKNATSFKVSNSALNKLVNIAGYTTWGDFKNNYKMNHKVAKVEWLKNKVDTGDITVETPSNSHIFLTEAGIFVHNSMLEDYYFAQTADGRGSDVTTLPGGENMGEIDDLRYFNNKMMRALGVPSSYLPTGPDDGSAGYNDGRVGAAFIQEFRFSKTCIRHQNKIIEPLDKEFKLYLKKKGYDGIDSSMFELKFLEPQNFSKYRQIELDSSMLSNFGSVADVPFISQQFALKKYLGWTKEEIIENEKLWKQENPVVEPNKQSDADLGVSSSMGEVGLSAGGGDFNTDEDGEFDVDEADEQIDLDGSGDSEPAPDSDTGE